MDAGGVWGRSGVGSGMGCGGGRDGVGGGIGWGTDGDR